MAKKATRARTPARIIWDLIAAEMQMQEITQGELAKRSAQLWSSSSIPQQSKPISDEKAR